MKKKDLQKTVERYQRQIISMEYEWKKEKELIYNTDIREKWYEQKIEMVIGGIDMKQENRFIRRPLYNITEQEAHQIAKLVQQKLKKDDITTKTGFEFDSVIGCYCVCVNVESFIRTVSDAVKNKTYDFVSFRKVVAQELGGGSTIYGSATCKNGVLTSLDENTYSLKDEIVDYHEFETLDGTKGLVITLK